MTPGIPSFHPEPDNTPSAVVEAPETTAPEEPGQVLLLIARKRLKQWGVAAPAALLLLLGYNLYFTPQSATATVSMSIQQAGAVTPSTLALLTGSGTNKRYIGILTSRQIAEKVARNIGLPALYPGKREEEVVEMLNHATRINDRKNDGLVYVDVTLPGPPRRAQGASEGGAKIRKACADAANAYAVELQKYYATTDNDRDALLLREADAQLNRARSEFDNSTRNFAVYASHTPVSAAGEVSLPSTPDTGGSSRSGSPNGTGGGGTELASLYNSLAQTETEIRATEAAQSVQQQMLTGQLNNWKLLPDEDPLLRESRASYTTALSELQNLQVRFGPKHPKVITARKNVEIAQEMLHKKIVGVRQKKTTEDVRAASLLESLKAKRDDLTRHISVAESRFLATRRTGVEYERLHNEMLLRLEVLKTTATETARLRLGTVSAQNRVLVVDEGRAPRKSTPGVMQMLATSITLVFLGLVGWASVDYMCYMLTQRKDNQAAVVRQAIRMERT